jgi:AP2-associated kinase
MHKTSKGKYLYILSEYCPGGHILDLLEKYNGKLKETQILMVLKHTVRGIKYMHQQDPPVAHRDIKVENILLHNKCFKLCDFGSASTNILDPNKVKDSIVEDEMENYEKYTTFMYRPPEMIDKYKGWKVGVKADIWMLGCVLFAL